MNKLWLLPLILILMATVVIAEKMVESPQYKIECDKDHYIWKQGPNKIICSVRSNLFASEKTEIGIVFERNSSTITKATLGKDVQTLNNRIPKLGKIAESWNINSFTKTLAPLEYAEITFNVNYRGGGDKFWLVVDGEFFDLELDPAITDFYYNGTYYIQDGADDGELALDGILPADGEDLLTHGWVDPSFSANMDYSTERPYSGTYSIKSTDSRRYVYLDNSSFTGRIQVRSYPFSGIGDAYLGVKTLGGLDFYVGYFGDFGGGENLMILDNGVGHHYCPIATTRHILSWNNTMMINFTGTNIDFYLSNSTSGTDEFQLCYSVVDATGIEYVRLVAQGGVTNYFDDFYVTNNDLPGEITSLTGDIYVNSSMLNDSGNGTSPSVAKKTIKGLNSLGNLSGRTILFARNNVWRTVDDSYIDLYNGNDTHRTTYSSYGIGSLPRFYGSANLSLSTDWFDTGADIWESKDYVINGTELLPNTDFTINTDNWTNFFSGGGGASGGIGRTTNEFNSSPASLNITIHTSGTTSNSNIQVWTRHISIENQEYYKLTFFMKGNRTFHLNDDDVKLVEDTSPFATYFEFITTHNLTITTEWQNYTVLYKSNIDSDDVRINFNFGLDTPDGTEVYIDKLSLQKITLNGTLFTDIGNILFDSDTSFGQKKESKPALLAQGDYFYNYSTWKLYMYSVANPSTLYNNIEVAVFKDIFDCEYACNNIDISFLGLYYSGRGAISMTSDSGISHNITISNIVADFHGGGHSKYSATREGNCLGFSLNCQDIIVRDNNISECYDACMSPQAWESAGIKSLKNHLYINNKLKNCAYGFEYFSRVTGSTTDNIIIEGNSFIGMGTGWSSTQTVGNLGRNIMLFSNNATVTNFFIRNNTFNSSSWHNVDIRRMINGGYIFDDNKYTQGYTDYFIQEGNLTFSVNESSSVFHNITFNNGANAFFTYDGLKDFTVRNNSLTFPNWLSSYVLETQSNTEYIFNEEGCVVPYEDMTITEDTVLCPNTYYLNDSGGDGVIKINAHSITLDCNDATLEGNGSGRGINFAIKYNVTIKNCNFNNYSRGINADDAHNGIIKDNTFIDIQNISVYIRFTRNLTIVNNTFLFNNNKSDINYNGIFMDRSHNTLIESNFINGSYYQIETFFSNRTIIRRNVLNNSYQNAIWVDRGFNNSVYNNQIHNHDHNGIDVSSPNSFIYDNVITGTNHFAIDFFAEVPEQWGSNNKVYGNNISNIFCNGMYIFTTNYTDIYNNRITNVSWSSLCTGTVITGISVQGNSTVGRFNNIYNNTIINISGNYSFQNCLFLQPQDTLIESNTLGGCGNDTILIQNYGNSITGTATFKNNIFIDESPSYFVAKQNTLQRVLNFSINETSMNHHNISLNNNGRLLFKYNGRKDFTVVNNTIYIRNLPNPSHDIFNVTGNVIIVSGVTDYNLTLAPNDEIIIDEFSPGIGSCDNYSVVLLNYSYYDEGNLSLVSESNAYIKVSVELFSKDKQLIINYSNLFNNTNNALICIESEVLGNDYHIDVIAEYESDVHVHEFEYIQNYSLNTAEALPIIIPLYGLLATESQSFLLTFKNEVFLPVDEAVIEIMRFYTELGQFLTVEDALTDDVGQTVGHFVEEDVIYSFIVKKGGTILGTFDNIQAICPAVPCQINLNQFQSSGLIDDFDFQVDNLAYAFDGNKTEKTVKVTFSTMDSTATTMNLKGYKYDSIGTTLVCDETSITSSGSVICSVPDTYKNASLVFDLTKDGEAVVTQYFDFTPKGVEIFGYTGYLMGGLLYLTLVLMAVTSLVGTILFAILGIVFAGVLGLVATSKVLAVGSAVIWFIIAGVIILWKITRRD